MYKLLLLLIIISVTYSAYSQDNPFDNLDRKLEETCMTISQKIPDGQTPVFALPPFRDNQNGIPVLGEYCAGKMGDIISNKCKNIKLVDRERLELFMKEKDSWSVDMFEKREVLYRSPAGSPEPGILKADGFILGQIYPVENYIMISVTMAATVSGEIKSQNVFVIKKDKDLESSLTYIQRPDKTQKPEKDEEPVLYVPPIELRYEIKATQELDVGDYIELKSGDQIDIRFRPISDCWVYILYHKSQGEWDVLFPHPDIKLGNDCRGGVTYKIPDPDLQGVERTYQLDNHTGEEVIFIIASYKELDDIKSLLNELNKTKAVYVSGLSEKLIKTIEGLGKDKDKALPGIKTRSIDALPRERGLVIAPSTPGEKVIKGKFHLVKKITIKHI